jgi:hypothetical protein
LKLLVRYTIAISADYQLHVVVNSIFGERRRVLDLRKCRECCVEKIDFPSGESYRVAELKTVTGTHRIWSFTGVGSARQFAQRVNAWVGRQDEVQPVLLDALCCVIAADGRVSSGERSLAIEGVTRLRPTLNPQWIDEQISLFVKRVNKSGFRQVVEETAAEIKDNSARLRDWVDFRSALLEVAKADGSVTRNQQLVINKLMAALEQGGATDTDGAHHVT